MTKDEVKYFEMRKKPVTFYSSKGFLLQIIYMKLMDIYILKYIAKFSRDVYRGDCAVLPRGLGMKSSSIALLTSDICGFLVAEFVSHISH